MSQENVELVRRGYEAWNRDDFDGVEPLLHPDVEWHSSGVFPGFEPVYRGPDGVRRWWETLKEPWEYFTIDIERIVDVNEHVVASLKFEAVGKNSGVRVELPFVNVFEVEEGLVVRYRPFPSWDEALEAVGLQE